MNVSTEHPEAQNGRDLNVTLIGTLPPHMGVADYTAHLVGGLTQARGLSLEVIDFVSLYPRWMYPGGRVRDSTARPPQFPNVRIRKLLAWYNPLSWLWAGLTLRGRVVHAQWWSYVLAPVYLTVLALARLRGLKKPFSGNPARPVLKPQEAPPWGGAPRLRRRPRYPPARRPGAGPRGEWGTSLPQGAVSGPSVRRGRHPACSST